MKNPIDHVASQHIGRDLLRTIWKFLTQDIRSPTLQKTEQRALKIEASSTHDLEALVAHSGPANTSTLSEADIQRITNLQVRRSILDWRDDFHFHLTETATQSLVALTEQVENELSNMNKLRRLLFARPTGEALKDQIDAKVRLPLRMATQVEQTKLRKLIPTWLPYSQPPVVIWLMWPKLEWDTKLSMKFTNTNRASILAALRELILGDRGIADMHRQWATQFAKQILELRNDRSDSI